MHKVAVIDIFERERETAKSLIELLERIFDKMRELIRSLGKRPVTFRVSDGPPF